MAQQSPNSVSYLTLLRALALKHRRDMPTTEGELRLLVEELLMRHWDIAPGSDEEWKILQSLFPSLKDESSVDDLS
jgi:hypothetical protein